MAKLVIHVPEQTFEYELSQQTYNYYLDDLDLGEDMSGWFDSWVSDIDPEKTWKVVE